MKMQILKNKSKISAITFVLVLTISATFVALPIVSAHDPPWQIETWSYVSASPNPVGVGQQVLLVFWSNAIPQTATGAYGDRHTFTVEITKPDNSKETRGPFTSDPVGGGWFLYTPDQVGTYTFVAHMAEYTMTGEPAPPGGHSSRSLSYIGDTYLASSSDPIYLTVQQEQIEPFQETPLPTQFWTRPISGINRDWYQVASNWLGYRYNLQNIGDTVRFNYGLAPETAHILWARPLWEGGLMEYRYGTEAYSSGMSYEDFHDFTPVLVINGKIYYNQIWAPRYGWHCLDLYTGEELYFHNTSGPISDMSRTSNFDFSGAIEGEKLAFGQVYLFNSPNQHGGFPYLWSMNGPEPNTWMMFDAYTGNYICSIANVSSSGTAVYGEDGSILRYRINNGRLTCWNTSRAIWYEDTWGSNEYWMWRPDLGEVFDGNNGFSLNVSIPDVSGSIRAIREGEFIIGGTAGQNDGRGLIMGNMWALSLEKGREGTLLWNYTFVPPKSSAIDPSKVYSGGITGPSVYPDHGVFLFEEELERIRWGYSLETGELLWGPTESEDQWMFYGMDDVVYQGKLYSFDYGGVLTCYNITTGEILWTYLAGTLGFETPYSGAVLELGCVGDGKIYFYSSEHSATTPLARGSYLRCIDASNGEELWKIHHWGGRNLALADGFIVDLNHYDNQLYCYGKGPSATTVTASPKVSVHGSSVMIEGTVTDQSPGAKDTPAIADEYMNEWMEYLYIPRPMPTDAKGVTVTLDAIDPNGNFIHIDTATSDISGLYSYQWTPEHEGKYTIIATFEGSKSYYSSYAETTIGVDPAPSPAQPIEPEPTEPTEAPFITTEIAIIIAVVVVAIIGIVAYWALKKRK